MRLSSQDIEAVFHDAETTPKMWLQTALQRLDAEDLRPHPTVAAGLVIASSIVYGLGLIAKVLEVGDES
jgi:hypothetical protein